MILDMLGQPKRFLEFDLWLEALRCTSADRLDADFVRVAGDNPSTRVVFSLHFWAMKMV